MENSRSAKQSAYRPIAFIIGAFVVSWICIFALESTYIFSYEMPMWLVMLFDFTKSAAPLIVALILLRKSFAKKGFLLKYILGEKKSIAIYAVVGLIFVLQFLTFYLFRSTSTALLVPVFLSTFAGQLLFGGGLEEGGWRGYLFPALSVKMPVLLSSIATSAVWTLWHLPYFFIPTSGQYGVSFFGYLFIAVMLGFLLSAIYMLTKSVLLCTLFHAFSNTLVMTMQSNMGNMGLIAMNAVVSIGGAVICYVVTMRERRTVR